MSACFEGATGGRAGLASREYPTRQRLPYHNDGVTGCIVLNGWHCSPSSRPYRGAQCSNHLVVQYIKLDPALMVFVEVDVVITDASAAAVRAGGGLPSPATAGRYSSEKPTNTRTPSHFLQEIIIPIIRIS